VIYAAGRYWGTDREIANALGPDIQPATVRRWHDRKGLTKIEGRYPLDEAATIEAQVRRSTRGRPRLDRTPIPA
jgi:hypothetical protein